MRELRVGEIVNMTDGGPCEVVVVPERGLAVIEPIIREKNITLICHNQKVKVIQVRRRSNITIEKGQYISFYI